MIKLKNLILIPLLIISLATFNLPVLFALAEEGGTDDGQTEQTQEGDNDEVTSEGANGDEETDQGEEGGDSYIETGDGQGQADLGNEVNSWGA